MIILVWLDRLLFVSYIIGIIIVFSKVSIVLGFIGLLGLIPLGMMVDKIERTFCEHFLTK